MDTDEQQLRRLRESADLHRALAAEASNELARSVHMARYTWAISTWRALSAQLSLQRSQA